MKAAIFESVIDAAIYRRNHGGWLFVKADSNIFSECYWFNASEYTPARILLHKLVDGLSGELVCDDRFVKAHLRAERSMQA